MSLLIRIAAVLFTLTSFAHAQDFPTQAYQTDRPLSAGGLNDIIARVVAAKMSELIGQPVVIDTCGVWRDRHRCGGESRAGWLHDSDHLGWRSARHLQSCRRKCPTIR